MSSSTECTDLNRLFLHLLASNFVLIYLIISFIILPPPIHLSAGHGCLFICTFKPSLSAPPPAPHPHPPFPNTLLVNTLYLLLHLMSFFLPFT